jgi:hypothetical protein
MLFIFSSTQRRLLTIAAVLVAASTQTLAAKPQAQRLALSCASDPHALGCAQSSHSPVGHAAALARGSAATTKAAKMPTSRKTPAAQSPNDGDRFQYDSCGCSGS